jgi:hypothetical protein
VTTFLLIFGLVVLAAILFVVWFVVRVVMWIVGALLGTNRRPPLAQPWAIPTASACARPNCRATNRVQARFCHRCGNAIAVGRGAASAVPMRYVA